MTKLVPIEHIIVPENRQRREFDEGAIQELVDSILERGLLQAPVVRQNLSGGYILVAGERRLRALKEIATYEMGYLYDGELHSPDLCPIVTLGELSELEAKEAELEENIRRVDLTWQERVTAEAELMALREEKARAAGKPAPKPADLSLELRGTDTPATATSISQALVLAKNLHRPEVAKAKTQTEAWKAMKRTEESERNAALAARLGKEHLSGKHTLVPGNCFEWFRGCPDASFDVICSDPPYGMGADEFGDSGGGAAGAHFYNDNYEEWFDMMVMFLPETFRLAKPNAHMYLFCDVANFGVLKLYAEDAGWRVFRTPLIWFKPTAFRAPWPEQGPQRKYETILYAVKGDLKCTAIAGDVLTYSPDENLGHQAQKPVALFKDLLSRSVRPGMAVLDPFCGTGPIFPAAHELSAIATGIELNPSAAGIAAGRLSALRGVSGAFNGTTAEDLRKPS